MNILHLSDTHGLHRQLTGLPAADVIVHSGDFTMAGTEQEAYDFMEWFCDLQYAHKIFIAGNHDMCLYGATLSGLDANCHYLCYSGICIEGVNFYGVPVFIEDAFSGEKDKQYKAIPADTNVLITHEPPHGILDFDDGYHYGSEVLLDQVIEIKPRLHLFGHIHVAHGTAERDGTTFSNAALLGSDYSISSQPLIHTI